MNEKLHRRIRTGLIAGVAPAFAFLASGTILMLIRPKSNISHLPLREVFAGLIKAQPEAFLSLGMLFLYLTPGIGTLSALGAFIKLKDKRGIAVTLVVLLVIAISISIRPE